MIPPGIQAAEVPELATDRHVTDDDRDDDDDDDTEKKPSFRAERSSYVGRGNVQAVRAARKNADLSDAFPKSDPLLMEFDSFLRVSGADNKDILNKASQLSNLLK